MDIVVLLTVRKYCLVSFIHYYLSASWGFILSFTQWRVIAVSSQNSYKISLKAGLHCPFSIGECSLSFTGWEVDSLKDSFEYDS